MATCSEIVALLLDAGADVHASSDAALRCASEEGNLECVELLLRWKADVHAEHDEALFRAWYFGHSVVVDRLLAAGADRSVMRALDLDDR